MMKRVTVLVLAALLACEKPAPPPAPPQVDEAALAAQVGVSDSALAIIRDVARGPLTGLHPTDSNGTELPPRGVAFGASKAQVAGRIAQLRERLGPGFLVFEAQRNYGTAPDSIGIIPSTDQFDILRVRNTDGINYDIDKDSVLVLVRQWHTQYDLEITGAALDWFEARIKRPPPDYRAFADVLFKVCPDIVTQGTNTVEALVVEMRRSNLLYCWWD